MPEGHSLHRLARSVRDAFGGRVLEVTSPQGRFSDGAALLDGQRLLRSEAHGKHLLAGFAPASAPPRRAPEHWLHVHLGLYGKVTFTTTTTNDGDGDGGPVPPLPVGAVRLRLVTLDAAEGAGPLTWADLRGPTACEVLTRHDVDVLLARLGPDPLQPRDDPARFLARVAATRTAVGALLMHQDVLAGAGNVYRAEVLYRAGLDPYTPGRAVDPGRLLGIWEDLRVLMRSGVRTGRIVTTRPGDRVAAPGERTRQRGRAGAHYVYRRAGMACRICGTPVATAVLAARNLFWCPTCQAPGATGSPLA